MIDSACFSDAIFWRGIVSGWSAAVVEAAGPPGAAALGRLRTRLCFGDPTAEIELADSLAAFLGSLPLPDCCQEDRALERHVRRLSRLALVASPAGDGRATVARPHILSLAADRARLAADGHAGGV